MAVCPGCECDLVKKTVEGLGVYQEVGGMVTRPGRPTPD